MSAVHVCLIVVILVCTIGGGTSRELTKVMVRSVPFWVDNDSTESDVIATNEWPPKPPLFPQMRREQRFKFNPSEGKNTTQSPFGEIKGNGRLKNDLLFSIIRNSFVHEKVKSNHGLSINEKVKYKKGVAKRSVNMKDTIKRVSRTRRRGSPQPAKARQTGSRRVRRIVGGSHCPVDSWPWLVSVQYFGIDDNWHHFCSGSLIDPNWVVTVAHCVTDLDELIIRVVLGDYQLSFASHHEQAINPSKIYMHTHYLTGGTDYDIAIIKLTRPALISSHIKTIPMASKSEFANGHATCYIAGWGNTLGSTEVLVYADYLLQSAMSLLTKSECRHFYQDSITDRQTCVTSDHASACIGDSGGPMVCGRDEKNWVLVGLASWVGSATCSPGVPNVYTRVGSLAEWINAVMANY